MPFDIRSQGLILRAAGVPYDIRRADPYGIYDRFDFDVAVRHNGDLMDNYLIRIDEIRQSLRILEQAIKQIPSGADQLPETGVPGPGPSW
jgi:NADH-quinone oxidoreductase subunit D/NADH-quinone oxidoreductase subunit C/D